MAEKREKSDKCEQCEKCEKREKCKKREKREKCEQCKKCEERDKCKKCKEKNIHIGHRERLRQKYIDGKGIGVFSQHENIEFLLYGAMPRVNTNEEAHILCSAFNNSYVKLFEASIDELVEDGKIRKSAAIYVKFLYDLFIKRYLIEKMEKILSPKEAIEWRLRIKYFESASDEIVTMLVIGNGMKILGEKVIATGNFNSANIDIRAISQDVAIYKSAGIILAHNHPDGTLAPTPDDITTTNRIRDALQLLGIRLFDHYIIANDNIVSMFYQKNRL